MDWLLLESYYDGSHRQLVDGLLVHVCPDARLWTLPGRKWKWRMRGAALRFADRLQAERPAVDAIFVTSLTNAAELRGLLARAGLDRPFAVYFHENQLAYPIQHFDRRPICTAHWSPIASPSTAASTWSPSSRAWNW